MKDRKHSQYKPSEGEMGRRGGGGGGIGNFQSHQIGELIMRDIFLQVVPCSITTEREVCSEKYRTEVFFCTDRARRESLHKKTEVMLCII